MARKPRLLLEGGIYHVTCRGNERRAIFKDDLDRERFLERLGLSAETNQVRVYLYCLMPNHLHLLVETPLGNLDRFMGSLLTGYTVYFNRRHRRAGHLMQGRYGAQVVEGNAYLLNLSRYIHLNPVHVRPLVDLTLPDRIKALRSYVWSSYPAYTGARKPWDWLCTKPVLAQMEWSKQRDSGAAYRRYVEAGLAKTDEEFVELMRRPGVAIGSDAFVDEIKDRHHSHALGAIKKEDVAFRHIWRYRSIKDVEAAVAKIAGAAWTERNRRKNGRQVRCLWAHALQRYTGLTQREVAIRLGLGTGSAISRMLLIACDDPEMKKRQKELELFVKG